MNLAVIRVMSSARAGRPPTVISKAGVGSVADNEVMASKAANARREMVGLMVSEIKMPRTRQWATVAGEAGHIVHIRTLRPALIRIAGVGEFARFDRFCPRALRRVWPAAYLFGCNPNLLS